jgi:hypothetical protein
VVNKKISDRSIAVACKENWGNNNEFPIGSNRIERFTGFICCVEKIMNVKEMALNWLAGRLPTCKEVTKMASYAMEKKLPLRERLGYRMHLLICRLCMRYVKQLQLMRDISQQHTAKIETGAVAPASTLSQQARERMKQTLHASS